MSRQIAESPPPLMGCEACLEPFWFWPLCWHGCLPSTLPLNNEGKHSIELTSSSLPVPPPLTNTPTGAPTLHKKTHGTVLNPNMPCMLEIVADPS